MNTLGGDVAAFEEPDHEGPGQPQLRGLVPCGMSYILDGMEEKPVSGARDLDAR